MRQVRNLKTVAAAALVLLGASEAALASAVMPSFVNAPTGWTTDRYAPASFGNVGSYGGRNDVLGIGIDSTGDAANRGGLNATFYNTQGKQYALAGGAGSVLTADLFINGSWADSNNGYVRTDMWGVMSNAANAVSDYTIIGFTNYGGAARLRVWDSDLAGGNGDWVNLAATFSYDSWTSLSIDFTGSEYDYYVNGALEYADTTIADTTQYSATIMQAYNFADPALGISSNADYTAHWSNPNDISAAVPEPGSMVLVGAALFGLVVSQRKRASAA